MGTWSCQPSTPHFGSKFNRLNGYLRCFKYFTPFGEVSSLIFVLFYVPPVPSNQTVDWTVVYLFYLDMCWAAYATVCSGWSIKLLLWYCQGPSICWVCAVNWHWTFLLLHSKMVVRRIQSSDNGNVLHLVEHMIIFILFQAVEGLVYMVMVHSLTHN